MEQENQSVGSLAISFVNETWSHLFITGKAGTGKTALLKKVIDHSHKKIVIAAPTGVAAVNAQGVTIHSFFRLPAEIVLPIPDLNVPHLTTGRLLKNWSVNAEKESILLDMETLLIDEVSMLRADTLDAIDAILRYVRGSAKPFGGVQVVMFGDLFQLPPVITNDEIPILKKYYSSPFFFDARCIRNIQLVTIELTEIYRQHDPVFLKLLNNIRLNVPDQQDLQLLASKYRGNADVSLETGYIRLTTHRINAEEVNRQELAKLPGKVFSFQANSLGIVDFKSLPVEEDLQLKHGAQVMFVKNDTTGQKRYFNGKIGVVSEISDEQVKVTFPDGNIVPVQREKWEVKEYAPKGDGEFDFRNAGEFSQFPLRLAWAITIHKSQGLTFEKAIIDAGSAFAPGQVYVALSRLKSLDGLMLSTPLTQSNISTHSEIITYLKTLPKAETLENKLLRSVRDACLIEIKNIFDFSRLSRDLIRLPSTVDRFRLSVHSKFLMPITQLNETVATLSQVAVKFMIKLDEYWTGNETKISEGNLRLSDAANYFNKQLANLIARVIAHLEEMEAAKAPKQLIQFFETIQGKAAVKMDLIGFSPEIWAAAINGQKLPEIRHLIESRKIENFVSKTHIPSNNNVPEITATQKATLKLLNKGLSLAEIAVQRKLSDQTVESHVLFFIEKGWISVKMILAGPKINAITKAIERSDDVYELKAMLGENFSYFDIRAVLAAKRGR